MLFIKPFQAFRVQLCLNRLNYSQSGRFANSEATSLHWILFWGVTLKGLNTKAKFSILKQSIMHPFISSSQVMFLSNYHANSCGVKKTNKRKMRIRRVSMQCTWQATQGVISSDVDVTHSCNKEDVEVSNKHGPHISEKWRRFLCPSWKFELRNFSGFLAASDTHQLFLMQYFKIKILMETRLQLCNVFYYVKPIEGFGYSGTERVLILL